MFTPRCIKVKDEITIEAFKAMPEKEMQDVFLIDVRRTDERILYHIGGHHFSIEDMRKSNKEGELKLTLLAEVVDIEMQIVIYYRRGVRSYEATRMLKALGFKNVKSLAGGMDAWQKAEDIQEKKSTICCTIC